MTEEVWSTDTTLA